MAGARHEVLLPLPGRFQADNALLALMLIALLVLALATKLWYIGSVLVRARVLNLQQESRKQWVIDRYGESA